MAILTPALIQALFVGFRRDFQAALNDTPTAWQSIATRVPSTTKSNTYGWLGQFPQFREWIGPRVLKDMAAHGYSIENKDWESSVSIRRPDIEDDNVGIYSPLFSEMGRAAKAQPDELVFGLLKDGFTVAGYDGQNFFDDEHPVYPNVDGTGTAELVANHDVDLTERPDNPIWYLMDTSRAIKPLIFQERKAPVFTPMTRLDDEEVFTNNVFRFGADSRNNVGFGFWQFAYGSKQTLDKSSYKAARTALMGMKGDYGRPLGLRPRLLVVPPALEEAGLELLNAERDAAGATNVYRGTAELLVCEWL